MWSMRSILPLWRVRYQGGGGVTDWNGYTGKILVIDLTRNKISTKEENIEDIRRFVGGMGMNCMLAAEYIQPRTEPLSSKNVIIIGAGPLVGTITPGASRLVGISKFPASGAIANSCGSMSFGFHLKQAGYDHVIVIGKAENPVFLEILDDHVELCDARKIWGRDIVETTNLFWKQYDSCGVIAIGQAGENLVFGALALIDKTSTFGRGGLGAIMGSKNLKALVCKGTKGIPIANPSEFNKLYKKQIQRIRNYPYRNSWVELGMLRSLPVGMIVTAKGQKKKARECSERIYLKKLKKRRIACPSCPMADKDILEIEDDENGNLITYASSVINPFLMLTLDGLDTCDQAIKSFNLISRYGLDSLTITALFDFLNKMVEKGVLSQKEIGFEWRRDFNTLIHMIEIIARRKGFGDLLADGWMSIAKLNKTIANEMLTVKGLDVVFEPRFLRLGTMEFEQIVNPKGAHVASGGSPTYVGAGGTIDKFKTHFKRMGIPDSAMNRIFSPPLKEMGINVGRLTRYSEDWYTVLTSLGLCARAQMNRFYGIDLAIDFYNAVTGIELTKDDLRISAERTWNLLKLLNVKEGFSKKDDTFPPEWFKPLNFGESKLNFQDFYGGTMITVDIANQLLNDYYDERGWDISNGIPTREKVKELNLEKYF